MENKNYITELVYVETPVDLDEDGYLDLMAVFIKRPICEEKVPAIFIANPYLLHCNEEWYDLHDVNKDLVIYPEQNIDIKDITYSKKENIVPKYTRKPLSVVSNNEIEEYTDIECISDLYDKLLPYGYATIYSGGLGTRFSDGTVLTGSHEEILAFKAVIDWLNGRARAFTDKTGNIEVKQEWCSGNVAMSGKSYLGTLAIGMAMENVDGLKTIIPEAGISNWYEYYRTNGLVYPALGWQGDDIDLLSKYCFSRALDEKDFVTCKELMDKTVNELNTLSDRQSGNYNLFWDERNYLKNIDNMKCSALIIQGLADYNVKPSQAINLYKEMEKRGMDRKMILHRGQHIYIYNLLNSPTFNLIKEWLDYYLKGIENNINNQERIYIESAEDVNRWDVYSSWNSNLDYRFIIDDSKILKFVDDNSQIDRENIDTVKWLDNLILGNDNSAIRLENVLVNPLHISGDIEISFEANFKDNLCPLSAMLVEVSNRKRYTSNVVGDVNKSFTFKKEETKSKYKVLSRSSLNPQNKDKLYSKNRVKNNEYNTYSFKLQPCDATVRDKLVLIIYGTDIEETLIPFKISNVEIKQESIECLISTIENQ